jgi:predicted DNA-binding transcriptional regulator YafY
MSTFTNILTVLNLLHNRQSVSIQLIQRECSVSRSTAYRYITALSEANFPVISDPEVGGFRLAYKWGKGICNFSEAEADFILKACEQNFHVGTEGDGSLGRSIRRKLEVFRQAEGNSKLRSTG